MHTTEGIKLAVLASSNTGRLVQVRLLIAAIAFSAMATSVYAQDRQVQAPIDPVRGRQLMERSSRGETLTAEDQAYLDRVKQAIKMRAAAKQPASQPVNSIPKQPTTPVDPADWAALVPITDMRATDRYKGEDGGLYGGGQNVPPDVHRMAHLQESQKIRPLDADGAPSDDGKIGLITIGFSNTSMESEDFKRTADTDPNKSSYVNIVNGSIGGRSAVMWAWDGADVLPKAEQERLDMQMDLLHMPKSNRKSAVNTSKDTWPTLANRIEAAGLSA